MANKSKSSRKRRFGIPLLIIFILLSVYGCGVEPFWLDVEEVTADVANLPPSWAGKKVGVLADFQIGMWADNEWTAKRGVAEAIEQDVDLLLFAGDFLYKATNDGNDQIGQSVEIMRPLTDAGIPTYAVLGNHDYSIFWREDPTDEPQIDELIQRMDEIGVKILRNESVALPTEQDGETPLYIVGIDSVWADRALPLAALQDVPLDAPRIAFMHNPNGFLDFPATTAPLAIAGHTHAGQIRVPLIPERDWLGILHEGELLGDGWAEDDFGAEGNRLYVNRGIGFSWLPVRINARPELTIITLEKE